MERMLRVGSIVGVVLAVYNPIDLPSGIPFVDKAFYGTLVDGLRKSGKLAGAFLLGRDALLLGLDAAAFVLDAQSLGLDT